MAENSKQPYTANEAILVHDIGSPHPRLKYIDDMIAKIAEESRGLRISINPGGKIAFPGIESINAVFSLKAPLTLANTALLSSINPKLGFVNLPFSINDELMGNKTNADQIVKLVQKYLESVGLKILGIMRGADTILIMKDKHINKIEDLQGMRIRVAAPGIYEDILRCLGANPVPLAAIEIDPAFKRGELDGMISSPGGWVLSGPIGPKGSLIPGMIFYTYSMIANLEWFSKLPAIQQKTLEDAARTCITEKWSAMKKDDLKVISDLLETKGGQVTFTSVPAGELEPWKKRVATVWDSFKTDFPDVMENFKAAIYK
jgi:C4-dicarboxylate-binding protein DctP